MKDYILVSLVSIPTLGVIAQWIAIRLKFPSILLLLLSGFIVGPVLQWLHPDQVFKDMLYPFISLSVAIILFEGGLTLRISDLTKTGNVVRNLIFIGGFISWVLISIAAHFLLGFDIQLAVLLGSILLVSGPTVVTPLLRQIKLKHTLSSVLRWEGIIIDPIGASLAVLVYEIIIIQETANAIGTGFIVILSTLLSGFFIGSFGAIIIIVVFKKQLIPDYLQEAFTFVMVLATYVIADLIQAESGLLVVTMMGIFLANQKIITIRHIVSFKENITILLISSLFIVLAARIELSDLINSLSISMILFLVTLIVIVRPVSVFLSCANTNLKLPEKFFLSFLYPRGIVAAAVASLFSFRLAEAGFENADLINPVTFYTIIFTVTFYGLLGRPLVNLFSQQRVQQGVVLVGAHRWARLFAQALDLSNMPVLLIDTNIENILASKELGLTTKHGSILSKKVMDEIEMSTYGKLLAITSSDETNLLASIEYSHFFTPNNVLRSYPKDRKKDLFIKSQKGKFLFNKGITTTYIESLITAGNTFKPTTLSAEFTYEDFVKKHPRALVLCMINRKNRLKFFFEGHRFKPVSGCILITLRK
jgi:NhaP-type Na+/H+ or K+/H+ antiporter